MEAACGTRGLISTRPSGLLASPRWLLQETRWGEESTKVLFILGLALGPADNAKLAEKI